MRGRRATDLFSDTRAFGGRPDNVLPLGAREFARGGYLWGPAGGPIALLVHGWAADSSSMHSLVAPLRDKGFTVAAFDAPAHGVHNGRTATMTQYANAVATVLPALGDVRVLVAHSLGAIAAVSGAALADVKLAGVAMIAPTCTLSGVLDRWSPGFRVPRDRVYQELHRRNGVPVSHWDMRARGAGLGCPILVAHDPDDPVVPYADAQAIASTLPDVRLVPAPGRGHFEILMAPEVKQLVAKEAGR